MKRILSILSISGLFALTACNSTSQRRNDDRSSKTNFADTVGLSQFQAWKAQNELANPNQVFGQGAQTAAAAAAPARTIIYREAPARRSTASRSTSSRSSGGSMSSTGSNSAKAKKGWSKAAKGAAIGAGTGAVVGAVVNKKNRVVGGVVGGVLGGGVGYGIGRKMDKKDGRY
jgi:hypothetical protein